MLSRTRVRERRNLQPPGALKLEGPQHGRKHFPVLTLATGPSHMSSTLILLSAKDHFKKISWLIMCSSWIRELGYGT